MSVRCLARTQFWKDSSNLRDDEYGGSDENKGRWEALCKKSLLLQRTPVLVPDALSTVARAGCRCLCHHCQHELCLFDISLP
jgi:hypothetical protein